MKLLKNSLLSSKKDIELLRQKRRLDKQKSGRKFNIRQGITLSKRRLTKKELHNFKVNYQHTMKDNPRSTENQVREKILLTRSRSEKVYKTIDELVNISERLEIRHKKEDLLSLKDNINTANTHLPYTERKQQLQDSLEILERISDTDAVYKDFLKAAIPLIRNFLEVDYYYYVKNFTNNVKLKDTFKQVFSMETNSKNVAYHPSFLERFLIFLNKRFNTYEESVEKLENRIGRLTGKLKEEAEKNYEQTLEKKIHDLEDEIEKFDEQKEEFSDRIVELKSKLNHMTRKYNDLESDYAEMHRKNENLEKQFDMDQYTLSKKQKEIEQFRTVIESLNGKKEDYVYQVRGIKVKASKMSNTLKKFTEKITRYIEENKELKNKLERIQQKNNLGYESLTPRPDYQEIFKRRNLDVRTDKLGIKIAAGKLSSAQITEELINKIKVFETERILNLNRKTFNSYMQPGFNNKSKHQTVGELGFNFKNIERNDSLKSGRSKLSRKSKRTTNGKKKIFNLNSLVKGATMAIRKTKTFKSRNDLDKNSTVNSKMSIENTSQKSSSRVKKNFTSINNQRGSTKTYKSGKHIKVARTGSMGIQNPKNALNNIFGKQQTLNVRRITETIPEKNSKQEMEELSNDNESKSIKGFNRSAIMGEEDLNTDSKAGIFQADSPPKRRTEEFPQRQKLIKREDLSFDSSSNGSNSSKLSQMVSNKSEYNIVRDLNSDMKHIHGHIDQLMKISVSKEEEIHDSGKNK